MDPVTTDEATLARLAFQALRDRFYDPAARLYREHHPPKPGDRPYSFVWPYSGVLFAAIALAQLPGAQDEEVENVRELADSLQEYWNPAEPVPGYDSCVLRTGADGRFYDDNEWIGMVLLDAAMLLQDSRLFDRAVKAFRFAASGWDNRLGGGVLWKEGGDTKNTCSNGPLAVLALRLHAQDPKPEYFDTAVRTLRWTARLKDPETGVYWDHLRLDGAVDKTTWTYNTGTILHAHALLHRLTGDSEALAESRRLADASLRHFAVMRGKIWTFPRMPWFNVVLLRGYLALFDVNRDYGEPFVQAFRSHVHAAWRRVPDQDGLFGDDWTNGPSKGPSRHRWLLDQAAMAEAAALLAVSSGIDELERGDAEDQVV